MSARQVTKALHSCGKIVELSGESAEISQAIQKYLLVPLCTRLEGTIKEQDPRGLANSLWACAKMAHQPKEITRSTLISRIHTLVEKFNATDCAMICWSLFKLRWTDVELWGKLKMQSCRVAVKASPKEISMMLFSFARALKHEKNNSLKLIQHVEPIIEKLDAQSFANIMWSLEHALATVDFERKERCRKVIEIFLDSKTRIRKILSRKSEVLLVNIQDDRINNMLIEKGHSVTPFSRYSVGTLKGMVLP
eukprot:UC4_evm1s1429